MGPPHQELVERFSKHSFSRRDLIIGVLAGVTPNLLQPTIENGLVIADCLIENKIRSFPDVTLGLKAYDEGFKNNNELRQSLINSSHERNIPFVPVSKHLEEGVLFDGIFSLDKPEYVALQVNGTETPFKHLQVLDIRLNEGIQNEQEEYYHPILDTEKDKKAITSLHDRRPGEYRVTVRETPYSYGIRPEDLNLQVKAISTDNPLFRSIIRRSMNVRLRKDNLSNIAMNMPVRSRWDISENDERSNILLVKLSQDLIGQRTGTDVCRAKHPADRETYAMDLYTESGLLLEQVGQEGVHHDLTKYPLVDIPSEVTEGMAIDVVIFTQNNIPTRNQEYFTNKIVSVFDEYRPIDEEYDEQRDIALITNAYQEWHARGELDKQSSEVDRFIKEKLGGIDIIRT